MLPLKSLHILTALITWPGTMIQIQILTIRFIVMAMKSVKTPPQPLIQQLIWIMNPTTHHTLAISHQQMRLLCLMFAITVTLRPKNTASGITPRIQKAPAGLVDQHFAHFYCSELKFLDDTNNKQPLTANDKKVVTFCATLHKLIAI